MENILQQNKLLLSYWGKSRQIDQWNSPEIDPHKLQSSDLRQKCKGYLIEEKDSFQLLRNCFT